MLKCFQSIQQELKAVEAIIKKELSIKKAGHVGSLAYLEFSHLNRTIRPAVVIFTAQLFNFKKDAVFPLAAIMQFIYMASQIHANITETDPPVGEAVDPRDGCQFPVLVGDYLYGKFFALLSDAAIIEHLGPLADIICSVNEGAVMKNQYANELSTDQQLLQTIVGRDHGDFFAGCCSLAAKASEAGEEAVKQMHDFGFNFGIGYGLLEWGAPFEQAEQYFNKAREALDSLTAHSSKQKLYDFLDVFGDSKLAVERMVG